MINKIVDEDVLNIIRDEELFRQYKDSTVLITGGNGMIASYIVYCFMMLNDTGNYNIHVIAAVRNKEKAALRFSKLMNRDDFAITEMDICGMDMEKIDVKIDYILHMASQASPNQFINDPVGTLKVNSIGTYNVLELAKAHKVKSFLYTSTREIYGEPADKDVFGDGLISEKDYGYLDPVEVRSCYPEGKRFSENLCIAYNCQYQVPYCILRISHTYGYGMDLYDGRVIADLTKCAVLGEDIVLKSDGAKKIAITYIADTVAGIFTALHKKNINEVYNLSNQDAVVSIKEIAEYLAESASLMKGDKKLKVIFNIPGQTIRNGYSKQNFGILDCKKLINKGFEAKYGAKEGLARTVAAFMRDGEPGGTE